MQRSDFRHFSELEEALGIGLKGKERIILAVREAVMAFEAILPEV